MDGLSSPCQQDARRDELVDAQTEGLSKAATSKKPSKAAGAESSKFNALMRPVTVLVSEQEIDYLLASGYQLSRLDAELIGRAVSQFLSDSALFMPGRSA